MLVLSLTHHLKGTNSSALEVFNPLFLDFLGTATMSGLRLRLELMSLTKRRTEYYLTEAEVYISATGKNEFTCCLLFLWLDKKKKPIDCFRVRQYVLTDSIDKYLFHHSIILLTDKFLFFQNTSVWRTKILVELISIMLLKTHSKSDSHPNQKTWFSLHLQTERNETFFFYMFLFLYDVRLNLIQLSQSTVF